MQSVLIYADINAAIGNVAPGIMPNAYYAQIILLCILTQTKPLQHIVWHAYG